MTKKIYVMIKKDNRKMKNLLQTKMFAMNIFQFGGSTQEAWGGLLPVCARGPLIIRSWVIRENLLKTAVCW